MDEQIIQQYQIIEVWGEVQKYHNDAPDGVLYHCTTPDGNFDFWTDAQGNLLRVTPSVISPE